MTTLAPYRDNNMNPVAASVSVRGVRLERGNGREDLLVRVTAPAQGDDLPVILFSHGHGSSMDGYAPLADHWAMHGFVVIQPTYPDAKRLALAKDDSRRPHIWRQRVADARLALDHLAILERALPGLEGRIDHGLIAAAGHSFGGQTTSLLLGARMAGDGGGGDMRDDRIKAGILLASAGRGGDLSDFGRIHTPYLDTDFGHLTTPTLVVAGDNDRSPLTSRGPDWFTDPYYLAPGASALLTMFGGEHMLGGISGYDVTETTDENPERVACVQQVTTAFLRDVLTDDPAEWGAVCSALAADTQPSGKIEQKQSARPDSRET